MQILLWDQVPKESKIIKLEISNNGEIEYRSTAAAAPEELEEAIRVRPSTCIALQG